MNGVRWGMGILFPIMENQLEGQWENEMETPFTWVTLLCGSPELLMGIW